MTTNVPEFRLRCPQCNGSRLIEVRRFLDSVEPCAFIRCEECRWENVALQGARAAAKAGQAVYQRDLDAALAAQRAKDAASNTAREATERQQRIALAEATIRAWATGAVSDRVVNRGTWEVRLPELEGGLGLDDLSEETRAIYTHAEKEAQREADRLNVEAAARLAQVPAIQARMWDERAKREQAERKRRREEQSDVFISEGSEASHVPNTF